MFIDPGNVAIRFNHPTSGTFSKLVTIWSAQIEAEEQMQMQVKQQQRQIPQKKTLAQQLIEEDQAEEDVLFSMLADELREPAYITPVIDQFPTVPVSRVALGHSRSSSRSSLYSCSSDESLTSCGTFSSGTSLTSSSNSSSSDASGAKKQSRRERARQARVFVDKSKNEVTPYDGGKTTVLTGGVMLGAVAGKKTRQN
jgi:protein Tob/BTG